MSNKKSLLITASTFPRWEGDTEPRFILDYAKAMSRYYDITVMVPAAVGAKDNEILEGVKVKRFHYFPIHKWETLCYPGAIVPRIKQKKTRLLLVPFLLVSMYLELKKEVKKYDLVHANWLIPQGIVQSFVKTVPYIVTGHGGDVTSLNVPFMKHFKVRALQNASKIVTVSKALDGCIQSLYPNHKSCIISMGCDVHLFNPGKRIENYFGQGHRKVVLFVGRLVEIKGITYLIEAMRYIDDAVLIIVGAGDLQKTLSEQAQNLGEKVIFYGARTHQELPAIYASADVFVAPSITLPDGSKEGFGLVIIEAMASGLPIIASKSGGITDSIQDNYNGLLCEEKCVWQLVDNINSVLNDKALADRLRKNGIATANQYSYDVIAENYKNAIDDCAGRLLSDSGKKRGAYE